MHITWYLKVFNQISTKTLWKIYRLREQVFIIEQHSLYPDIDKQDLYSYHVYATDNKNNIVAYARFFKNVNNISFGRVVVPKSLRGKGLGKSLVNHTLKNIYKVYGHQKIVIEAQYYAKNFYKKFGFCTVGKPFIDALRKHIRMIKN